MNEEKINELIAAIKELTAALKNAGAMPKKQWSNDASDAEIVGDIVKLPQVCDGETMPFGKKHRDKPLHQLPVDYVLWMAREWQPKGYAGDDALIAMIAAVCQSKGVDLPSYCGINDAPRQPSQPALETDEEIPF